MQLCYLSHSRMDASAAIGLYRLAAEDSDDSLLASVSVAASLPILLPYLSSASASARMLNVKMLTCYPLTRPLILPSSTPLLTLSFFFSPYGLVLGATRLRGLPSQPAAAQSLGASPLGNVGSGSLPSVLLASYHCLACVLLGAYASRFLLLARQSSSRGLIRAALVNHSGQTNNLRPGTYDDQEFQLPVVCE